MQLRSFRSDFIYGLEGRSSLLQRKVKNEWLLSTGNKKKFGTIVLKTNHEIEKEITR